MTICMFIIVSVINIMMYILFVGLGKLHVSIISCKLSLMS